MTRMSRVKCKSPHMTTPPNTANKPDSPYDWKPTPNKINTPTGIMIFRKFMVSIVVRHGGQGAAGIAYG
ncbi:hypothetical protein D3C71_1918550 [compost metagenome]